MASPLMSMTRATLSGRGQALLDAAAGGDDVLVQKLLDEGVPPDWRDPHDKRKCTPLAKAAKRGHTEASRLLLEAGAGVNWRNGSGVSPLFTAALDGNEDVARLLLKHKADTSMTDLMGRTALQWADEYGHEAVAGVIKAAAMDLSTSSPTIDQMQTPTPLVVVRAPKDAPPATTMQPGTAEPASTASATEIATKETTLGTARLDE